MNRSSLIPPNRFPQIHPRPWSAVSVIWRVVACTVLALMAAASPVRAADTTHPTITCPPDQVVPATSSQGAYVYYPAPVADDDSGSVTVVCDPPSPSQLPIGPSPVTCTATDPSNNSASCMFVVTVVQGGRAIKTQVLNELSSLLPNVSNSTDRSKLQDAINHLNKSLNSNNWIDDVHPKPGSKGETAFNEEKPVVNDLKSLRNSNKSGLTVSQMQDYIDRLVDADRQLAVTAINEAIDRSGNAAKINSAQTELGKGDTDAANDHPDKAIDHYKNAWKYAIGA